ncbi:MAG: LamG-like jellyroll fold domain-containing protein [Dehalococcoidia bacterium]|nr:LamG-like jellyroll fold domain-containing protein [Dehalococcoidia bacterium]
MALLRYDPVPGTQIPRPGSSAGDQLRDAFYHDLLALFGDTRLLWTPETGETTTSTDRSRNARVFTYDATVAARYSRLGSLWALNFDGTDDEADTPDADGLSFGDGAVDQPMSIVALVKPDVNDAAMSILAKQNSDSVAEFRFNMTSSGHFLFQLNDADESNTIRGTFATALGTDWILLSGTYDGSADSSGITLYKDGLGVLTARTGGGTYVAMENTAALVHLGARYTTKEFFFDGSMAFVALVARQVNADEQWAIAKLCESYYGLSLT